jgi:Amt family ammonium transporter
MKSMHLALRRLMLAASMMPLLALSAVAQAPTPAALAAAPALNSGDTAWMLTSTALVLMMTIPGLALFYGGMVRKMNVLTTVMQSFAVTCLVTVLWMVCTYSFAFTTGSPFLGGTSRFLLQGMTLDSVNDLAKTIPESVYMCFQMTFAIITPALICGAFADRMKFSALLWFIGLWLFASMHRLLTGCGGQTASSTTRAYSISPAERSCTSTRGSPG